ncbi:hypothetical protein R3P38DRAFT_3237665 [Favolaschia claudopus]|uniref:Uncharacterized protein n=1 Tax=Favolaschia claudopus TaxID=2862362 RepID=A0AAV9ZB23_9AGAR
MKIELVVVDDLEGGCDGSAFASAHGEICPRCPHDSLNTASIFLTYTSSLLIPLCRNSTRLRFRHIVPQLLTTTTAPERSDEEDVVEVDPPPRYVRNPNRTERTASSRGRTGQRPILPIPNTTNLPEGYARRTVPLPRRLRAPPARPRFSRKWSAPIADQLSRVKGLTDCLDMTIKLFAPYADYNMGETDISVQREEARRDDNRNHSWIETLYNDTRNARLPKAMILLLEAQHNFEEELGQPHSPLPGANIICHHLNRPALPDELDRLAQPHLPYADWEPFLAAMYCIFGDHAKTPLIESILTRAPFPHHLIDVPVYFKAHMGPDDLLVQQLAMIRQMLESIIGRISVMVGETPELHGTAPHRKWARENAARRMWYPRYAVPDSVLAIAPRRNTYPSDLIQPYGPHPLLYTFEVEFLRWAAVALTGVDNRFVFVQDRINRVVDAPCAYWCQFSKLFLDGVLHQVPYIRVFAQPDIHDVMSPPVTPDGARPESD